MKIILKNEKGSFEIGGGSHHTARLSAIKGIGMMAKDVEAVVYEGQPGRSTTDVRDDTRTVTMSFDFYASPLTVTKLYKIISNEVEIQIYLQDCRRKIKGRIVSATDVENIIHGRWYSATLQFICDMPYFTELTERERDVSAVINHLPNVNTDGVWYVELPTIASRRTNRATISNDGDMAVFPRIMLKNNKSVKDGSEKRTLQIKNHTTGVEIKLYHSLEPEEVITIDIPRRRITSSISGIITNEITDDTYLYKFKLIEGENDISFNSSSQLDDVMAKVYYYNSYIGVVI